MPQLDSRNRARPRLALPRRPMIAELIGLRFWIHLIQRLESCVVRR